MQRRLSRNILLRQVPRKCESARIAEPILCSRDWRTIKFVVHTQIQREKSFQTVSGRDEEAIEKLEGKDLFSPLASKSGGGSPPCRIACSTPGYNNCLCCNYARC